MNKKMTKENTFLHILLNPKYMEIHGKERKIFRTLILMEHI